MKNTNALKLTVYFRNQDKSKDFKTTESFPNIIGLRAVADLLKDRYKREGIYFPDITKAYYNGNIIIANGYSFESLTKFL